MGSKSRTLALLLTIIVAMSFLSSLTVKPANAQSNTITVPDDYADIQTAINHANDGDTVFVKAGTYQYNEQNSIIARPHSGTPNYGIIVNKSISLIGENRNTILSIDGSYGVFVTVGIYANDVTFSGFIIKNFSSGVYSQIGGVGILGSNCKIVNNIFQLYVSGIGNNQNISNNTFEGTGLFFQFTNSTIANNGFSNGGDGIDISGSSNVIVKGNNIEYVDRGIHLKNTDQSVNTNISIYQNNITNNLRFGVELAGGTSNSSIFDNDITNNAIGIKLSNFALRRDTSIGSGTEIFYNNVWGNTKNAYIEKEYPGNLANDMFYNRVIGNSTTVVSWDNGIVGNYWSDYNGTGFYVIDENNKDNYPLTAPVDIYGVSIPTPSPSADRNAPQNQLADWIVILSPLILIAFVFGLIALLLFRRHRKNCCLKNR